MGSSTTAKGKHNGSHNSYSYFNVRRCLLCNVSQRKSTLSRSKISRCEIMNHLNVVKRILNRHNVESNDNSAVLYDAVVEEAMSKVEDDLIDREEVISSLAAQGFDRVALDDIYDYNASWDRVN